MSTVYVMVTAVCENRAALRHMLERIDVSRRGGPWSTRYRHRPELLLTWSANGNPRVLFANAGMAEGDVRLWLAQVEGPDGDVELGEHATFPKVITPELLKRLDDPGSWVGGVAESDRFATDLAKAGGGEVGYPWGA